MPGGECRKQILKLLTTSDLSLSLLFFAEIPELNDSHEWSH